MASRAEWSCPICREAPGNIAYVSSCLHKFCRGCIVRWARKNPSCPLCRQTVQTIIYPAPAGQGFVEMPVSEASVPQSAGPREELGAAGPPPRAHVAGFPPETWAIFFSYDAEILRPLQMWLSEVLCGSNWCDVAFAQGRIVASLCRYGLHEEALVRELEPFLQNQTAAFVRQLIQVATDRCSELAWRRISAGPQQAGPSRAQEESREGPGQAGARAGTSGAGQSDSSSPGASWQSGRRRGCGSQNTGAAHKKPYRRQN